MPTGLQYLWAMLLTELLRSVRKSRYIASRMRDISRSRASQKRSNTVTTGGSQLRKLREERELSQEQLAELAGMHRNSIIKLEKGVSREMSSEHATALAAALRVRPADLGITIRSGIAPRSVRFRQLTLEQRQLVDELLSLPPEHYTKIRAAMEHLRQANARKRRRRR